MTSPHTRLAGPPISRRSLLGGTAAVAGAAVAGSVLPPSLRRAVARTLAYPTRSRLQDIKHIVILMQENRSFDHYFGTFPGVRGFTDPKAIKLPDGRSVFYQPDPSHADGYLLPFHYNTKTTSAQATPDTDHYWPSQHQAWGFGKMDAWIAAKGPYTMGYFTEDDIPFQWALAKAFTLCDNYHCSVLGPTNPNRLYMWSAWLTRTAPPADPSSTMRRRSRTSSSPGPRTRSVWNGPASAGRCTRKRTTTTTTRSPGSSSSPTRRPPRHCGSGGCGSGRRGR